MGYYLKIAHGKKMKKFMVRDPLHINLPQIKQSFIPPITSLHLYYELTEPINHKNPQPKTLFFKSEGALLDFLSCREYEENCTVRLNVYNTASQNDGQDVEIQGIEIKMGRNKSRSEEIKVIERTGDYSFGTLEATQEFLFHSLNQNVEKKEQVENMIKSAQFSLQKLKQESRETDISDLLDFLNHK